MLRFAPLGESCNVSSPRIENPYQSSAYAPIHPTPPRDTHDACHKYLRDVYDQVGIGGVFELMDAEMVRDIKTRILYETPRKPFQVSIGFEEMAVILVGIFLLILVLDS